MKKHILLLLFLLLALIVTCVYQKTYTVYSHLHSEEGGATHDTQQEVVIISKENELATKKQPLVGPSTISDPAEKPTQNVMLTGQKEALSSSQKKESLVPSTLTKMSTKIEEKEVIDYLLSVMKERDMALVQRDKEEAKLHVLIKKVLDNRRLAIENMHKVSSQIEKEHQERLAERDAKAQNITQEKGK